VLTGVNVDESTIVGDGEGTPLSVGTITSAELASDAAVLGLGIDDGTQLTGGVTLVGTSDVTLTQDDAARTITIDVEAPDGGLTSVATDGVTIEGDGTDTANALSIVDGGVGTDQLANDTAVRSLSGLQDVVTLNGDGIGVAPDGDTDTITLSIENEAIATAQLADDAITSAKIGVGEVTAAELAANAVGTNELADNTAIRSITADGATLSDEVTFDASGDASIAVSGNTITFSATAGSGGLTEVNTDGTTITGNGDGTALSVGTIGSAQIAENAITTTELDAGAVQTGNIANGAVGTTQLDDAAVTADKLEPGAAVRSLSADGGTNLTDAVNLIGGTNVTLNQVGQDITINASGSGGSAGVETLNGLDGVLSLTSGNSSIGISPSGTTTIDLQITSGAITTTELSADAVQEENILNGAVTSAIIADGTISAADIGTDAVTADAIAADAVGTGELADNTAVRSIEYQNGGTLLASFQDGVVLNAGTNLTFTDDGANTVTLDVDAVDATVLTDATLTGDGTSGNELGIANGAVGNLQLAENAVQSINIAENQVTASEIDDNAVGTVQLGVDAVQAVNIQNEAVTADKLSTDAAVLSIQDETSGSDLVDGAITFTSSDNTVTISADQVADEVDFIVNQAELTTAEPSAARYKEAVEQLENPAELLAQLRGVRYQWIEDGRADVGMIADEVAEVLPELVTFNDAGEPERLHYARLVAVLVEAAKEQQATVTQQQEQIDAMEARIARLERMVTQMAEAGN